MHLLAADFDYALPPERIARYPAERRSDARLLVVSRETGELEHRTVRDLPDLMAEGDLAVFNDSRVLPARFTGRKPTGARGEVLLLRPVAGAPATDWEALVRPGGKLKPGRIIEVSPELRLHVLDSLPGGTRVVRLDTPLDVAVAIERFGQIPLPPYIERPAEPLDRTRYQTVYARVPGSVAAPTAGLHFTEELMEAIGDAGVERAMVTLHVGVGTFRPVEVDDPAEHRMHEESFVVPQDVADAHERCRRRGGRIWAIGTTVVRTLESMLDARGRIRAGAGTTDLFIHPPHVVRSVDCLVTNFHLPRSTLLMLVSAIAGTELVRHAYSEAIRCGYRFYSYGDAMAVTP